MGFVRSLAALSLLPALLIGADAPPAGPAARVSGRIVIGADGTAELLGYYTHIEGVKGPLSADKGSEKTACFAFRTERSAVKITQESSAFRVIPKSIDSLLNVYYHPLPSRDFAKPDTFAEVQLIATFKSRTGEAVFTPGGEFTYTGTIELETSSDFVHEGKKYNFRDFGSSFTLKASGASPSTDDIIKQMGSGTVRLPFTGSASKAGQ